MKYLASITLDKYANEVLRFHGTDPDKGSQIVQQGFDHRLSGDRGLYGQGLYFTTDFCKAAKHCSTSDDLGRRCIILSRVTHAVTRAQP